MILPSSSAVLVGLIISALSYYNVRKEKHITTRVVEEFKKGYDYVVVGAGSAGATLASRLAEDHDVTVLVIEAGGQPNPQSEIPLLALENMRSNLDWAYETVSQENGCLGQKDKKCYSPRGKMLGGSSGLNFMVYVRGNHKDYDEWANQGAEGWSWKDVLPYFIKSEGNTAEPGEIDEEYHGRDGPLTVSTQKITTQIGDAFMEGGSILGYERLDTNGRNQTGVSRIQGTLRNGLRCSTNTAYLGPASHSRNLDVLANAHVTKIVIDSDKRARGVEFDFKGQRFTVNAKQEVILSAGALNSPQLLMLSGVGPRKELEELNIPVVADVPGVGKNLQDHIGAFTLQFKTNTTSSFQNPTETVKNHEELEHFLKHGTGQFGMLSTEAQAFIYTNREETKTSSPDVQLLLLSHPTLSVRNGIKGLMTPSEKLMETYHSYGEGDGFFIIPIIMRPKSRGSVTLASSNPFDAPLIDPKYFSNKDDLKRVVGGMKFVLELIKTEPFQKLGAYLPEVKYEGCNYARESDEQLGCIAKVASQSIYHPTCTCKMGDVNKDEMAVVNHELKVQKVSGLRVVDASVMPNIVSGNTNAAVIMIAEKAADIIKQSRKQTPVKSKVEL